MTHLIGSAESSKAPHQQRLGFRVLGYRIHTDNNEEAKSKDRLWGRELTEDNIQQGRLLAHQNIVVVWDGFYHNLIVAFSLRRIFGGNQTFWGLGNSTNVYRTIG
jgi:hypothetical protein